MLRTVQEDGYELFHRAIVGQDHAAWDAIVARYRPLLCMWARRCPAFDPAREPCEDLADEAFARAWQALTPERLRALPNMATLMAYLRACVRSTVIDSMRRQRVYERASEPLEDLPGAPFERAVLAGMERAELWALVESLLKSDLERLVVYERFVLGLPPRDIQARHPKLFPAVGLVHSAVRNLCERLRRHAGLAEYAAGLRGE